MLHFIWHILLHLTILNIPQKKKKRTRIWLLCNNYIRSPDPHSNLVNCILSFLFLVDEKAEVNLPKVTRTESGLPQSSISKYANSNHWCHLPVLSQAPHANTPNFVCKCVGRLWLSQSHSLRPFSPHFTANPYVKSATSPLQGGLSRRGRWARLTRSIPWQRQSPALIQEGERSLSPRQQWLHLKEGRAKPLQVPRASSTSSNLHGSGSQHQPFLPHPPGPSFYLRLDQTGVPHWGHLANISAKCIKTC